MRRRQLILFPLLAPLVFPSWAAAQDKKPVDLEVWVIRATTKNDRIAPELKEIAEKLKKQFKYTGFKLEKKERGRDSLTLDLLEGYKVTITSKGRVEKGLQLEVVIKKAAGKEDKDVLRTTVTLNPNEFFTIGCGDLAGGDYLIIALRGR